MSLEDILQMHYGCGKPFLKKRKIVGYYLGGEAEPDYEYLTVSGGKAYGKLTGLLYSLERLLGNDFDADRWISDLDDIVNSKHY
jgi:hypothetical protein